MQIPYFISTGEPSGDLLAADLVRSLQEQMPLAKPFGIVGPQLRKAGVEEVFGIEDLSVMGFVDVIRHFVPIKTLEDRLMVYMERLKPRFIVLVDYPGFHMHFAERLMGYDIPIFQYVAPQLWAWGEKRVTRLRRVTDKVLGIMPFEQKFFRERGVDFTYVGTPQVDRAANLGDWQSAFLFSAGAKVVGLFPGSRRGEVSRILPSMMKIARVLLAKDEGLEIAISMADSIELGFFLQHLGGYEDKNLEEIKKQIAKKGQVEIENRIHVVSSRSLQLMKRVDAALVTSGTATLECALTATPMAVIYVAGAVTYAIGKRLVKLDHISLVNLVANKALVNEYIQNIEPEKIAHHLLSLIKDPDLSKKAVLELSSLTSKLKGKPGFHASRAILEHLNLAGLNDT